MSSFIPNDYPVLYILMRSDLDSLNPGKAVAQGSHAANKCVYEINKSGDEKQIEILRNWEAEADGFGTCIVLSAKIQNISYLVNKAKEFDIVSGICHDPSYPLKDGETLHLIPLDTCGYIFGMKEHIRIFVKELGLMA